MKVLICSDLQIKKEHLSEFRILNEAEMQALAWEGVPLEGQVRLKEERQIELKMTPRKMRLLPLALFSTVIWGLLYLAIRYTIFSEMFR